MSWTDPYGLLPHVSFPSPDSAAIDALKYIATKSDHCAHEYAGWVYKEWSLSGPPTYTYDEPTSLGEAGGDLPPLPWFHGTYAWYHNHPNIPNHDLLNYSGADKDTSDRLNIPGYLLIPPGYILRYQPIPEHPAAGSVAPVADTNCACGR